MILNEFFNSNRKPQVVAESDTGDTPIDSMTVRELAEYLGVSEQQVAQDVEHARDVAREKAQNLTEEFDLIESIIDRLAEHNGVEAEAIWEDLESLSNDELYVFAVTTPLMEDWQKVNKQDRTAGMSRKAVKAYRRENPGSKLKTAVTTKPSKLKRGSKASKRRKSYCSRSRGQMKMHSISCAKTPDKAICKARRRWNCESVDSNGTMVAEAGPFSYGAKKPRQGSVADLAAKKRREQERGKQPTEPRDQQVGVAKVTKGVAEGLETNNLVNVAHAIGKLKGREAFVRMSDPRLPLGDNTQFKRGIIYDKEVVHGLELKRPFKYWLKDESGKDFSAPERDVFVSKQGVAEAFGPLPQESQKIRLGRHTVDIERVGLNKNYIGFAWHDSKGQEHYEEVAAGDLGSYDDLIARIKDEIGHQERQYTDQGVAEGNLKEFAPAGSGDGGDDGFSEETLKKLAAQWYNGDEDLRVERTLMAAGWEIGQDEGYDNEPGVFVVQAGDVNGRSYMSWPAHELKQGVAEGSLDDIEDTKQLKTAIALAKSQKAIRQAKYGKDQKFYADGTPVTPEEVARRAAERKAKKQGMAEVSDSTKQSYKAKAQAQVKELEPHAKKGEYRDIAQRAIDRRQRGLDRLANRSDAVAALALAPRVSEGLTVPEGRPALGQANITTLIQTYKRNEPFAELSFGNSGNLRINRQQMRLIMDHYIKLQTPEEKHDFVYETMSRMLKIIALFDGYGIDARSQISVPPGQASPVPGAQPQLFELDAGEVKDTRLSRALKQARAEFPTAGSDIEAFLKLVMSNDDRDLAAMNRMQAVNKKQSELIDRIQNIDQKQNQEIGNLESELDRVTQVNQNLERELDRIQSSRSVAAADREPRKDAKAKTAAEKPPARVDLPVGQDVSTKAAKKTKVAEPSKVSLQPPKRSVPQLQAPAQAQLPAPTQQQRALFPNITDIVPRAVTPDSSLDQEITDIVPRAVTPAANDAKRNDISLLDKEITDIAANDPEDQRQARAESRDPQRGIAHTDFDDPEWHEKVRRVGKRAKQGPLKTVWDPVKRVYRNVPVDQPTDKKSNMSEARLHRRSVLRQILES